MSGIVSQRIHANTIGWNDHLYNDRNEITNTAPPSHLPLHNNPDAVPRPSTIPARSARARRHGRSYAAFPDAGNSSADSRGWGQRPRSVRVHSTGGWGGDGPPAIHRRADLPTRGPECKHARASNVRRVNSDGS